MEEEFERTYLAKFVPTDIGDFPSKELLDIYVPSNADHPILRIRKLGDKYVITKKSPVIEGDSSHQLEQTISLTTDEYLELTKLNGKRLAKTRYYYQNNGVDYEIDVFSESLKGLVLIDVEFKSKEEKRGFKAPDFCLAEITQERFLAGGMLCGKSYNDLATDLSRYNYQKL